MVSETALQPRIYEVVGVFITEVLYSATDSTKVCQAL